MMNPNPETIQEDLREVLAKINNFADIHEIESAAWNHLYSKYAGEDIRDIGQYQSFIVDEIITTYEHTKHGKEEN